MKDYQKLSADLFCVLLSSANISSLLGHINWTQIQQYMTKEAEFLSQTNR